MREYDNFFGYNIAYLIHHSIKLVLDNGYFNNVLEILNDKSPKYIVYKNVNIQRQHQEIMVEMSLNEQLMNEGEKLVNNFKEKALYEYFRMNLEIKINGRMNEIVYNFGVNDIDIKLGNLDYSYTFVQNSDYLTEIDQNILENKIIDSIKEKLDNIIPFYIIMGNLDRFNPNTK